MSTPQLNGAYYGPSVLPPPQPHRRHHRSSSSSCCCNPFACLCKCFFNLICKLICFVLILFGIAVLILWLIFRPNLLKFHINNAALTQFDYSNTTLKYDLALNASVRNPNSRIGIYYDDFQVDAFYNLQRFSTVNVTPFYQGHKNTSDFEMKFTGQQVVVFDDVFGMFEKDKNDGVFEFELRMRLRMRFKLIKLLGIRVGKFKGKVYCGLKVPLNANGVAFDGAKQCVISYV